MDDDQNSELQISEIKIGMGEEDDDQLRKNEYGEDQEGSDFGLLQHEMEDDDDQENDEEL
jgi:hypothetical protein